MTDDDWLNSIKAGEDAGWKLVWERVIAPESVSLRSAEMMTRYSLTDGDLMGLLYEEMIGRGKIDLYRGEGSLEGWLKRYVRGYVLHANPYQHGEISIDGANAEADTTPLEIPHTDNRIISKDVWITTHYCFHDLWMDDPEKAYVHILKTRFHLSSEEVKEFLDISSVANVDQIFSRAVRFMRAAWPKHS